MTPDEEARVAAQRRNATVLALVLGVLVALIFALAMAKIGGGAPVTRTLTGTGRTALLAVLGIVFMSGVAWASVPLYRLFCQATGLNGTTGRAVRAPGAVEGKMRVAFDANVSPKLNWRFAPENESETIDIGARDMAFFTATNRADRPVTGTATFNVSPAQAGAYFKKIQCFCFTQQTLRPGETVRMPVVFYVDPAILKDPDARDIQTITLSYTFYPVDSAKTPG